MLKDDLLYRSARLQSARVEDGGGVLVLADIDDDPCAVELAASLRDKAGHVKVEVVVAVREFEAWFLAGLESLRRHPAVRSDAAARVSPESPRDAKGVLSRVMTESYVETLHQPKFAAIVDLKQARTARSFEHLVRCIGRIVVHSSSAK